MLQKIVRKHSLNEDVHKRAKFYSKMSIFSTPSLIYDIEGKQISSSKSPKKEEYKTKQ